MVRGMVIQASRAFYQVVVLVCGLAQLAAAADPIPAARFGALHGVVKPTPDEQQWEQVPWMTSLWEARQRAAAEGKPILLWEMDGHPLGST